MRKLSGFFIAIFLICQGCESPSLDLCDFFLKIDNTLTDTEKSQLIACKDIDCIMGFALTNRNHRFKELFSDIPNNVTDLTSEGYYCLIIAYNRERNGIEYDLQELPEEIIEYDIRHREESNKWFDRVNKERAQISEKQFSRIEVSDTIEFSFPINYIDEVCKIIYRPPYDDDEIIRIGCKVTGKKIIPKLKEDKYGHDDYKIFMEVVDVSHDQCGFNETISVGTHIDIELFQYSRVGNLVYR